MILETDPNIISARVSMRDAHAETPLAEQSLSQVPTTPSPRNPVFECQNWQMFSNIVALGDATLCVLSILWRCTDKDELCR